ncbi:hypothetical protein LJC53_06995, partial [Bacteroidales bacterium OttesenSCG-928-C03]|nr:hypothetical protein [Bacteroidales bacterium OttesenSCG-928-C03]
GATIQLQPAFDGYANADWLSFTVQPNTECYYSDINGMYQVHFLKRTHREDVVKYMFHVAYYPENAIVVPAKDFDIYVNAVENAQNNIIIFDTVKFNINEYRYKQP